MSIWTTIASWAQSREEQRKIKMSKPATKIDLQTGISFLWDDMLKQFEQEGSLIVQRNYEVIKEHITNLGAGISALLDHKIEGFKTWVEHGARLYDNACEHRHQEAEARAVKRQNHLMHNLLGIELHAEQRHSAELGAQAGFFRNTTEQLQSINFMVSSLMKPGVVPLPEWFLDNGDEVIRLGAALKNLRDNDCPAQAATLEVIKSIRALTRNECSITSIKVAIDSKADEWNLAAA